MIIEVLSRIERHKQDEAYEALQIGKGKHEINPHVVRLAGGELLLEEEGREQLTKAGEDNSGLLREDKHVSITHSVWLRSFWQGKY